MTQSSKNHNCLEGWRCPKCGQEDSFAVAASCWVELRDDGTWNETDFDWTEESAVRCNDCDWTGEVGECTSAASTP